MSPNVRRVLVLALWLLAAIEVDGRNIRRFPQRRDLASSIFTTPNHVASPLLGASAAGGELKTKENLECRLVNKKKYKDKCQFIKDNCEDEEVGMFDYLRLYYCKLPNAPGFAMSILGAWLVMLFLTIGIAASDFFCPNLETISKIMGMSQSVAGVTFLALGNGSPDVFSTFAAMKINAASLAIGELIGAASFITAVVAGSMAIVRPFRVDRRSFVRDISFFIMAIVCGIIFVRDGSIGLVESIVMISFYTFYVLFVIVSQWYRSKRRRRRRAERVARSHYLDEPEDVVEDDDAGEDVQEEAGLLSGHAMLSALERAQGDAGNDDDEYEGELEREQREYDELARSVSRRTRPGMERLNTSAIRPSLAGAMEFRALLHALEKNKNQFGGPFPLSRYQDEPRRHVSAPQSLMAPRDRRYSDAHPGPINTDELSSSGRARAVSVNDLGQPMLDFEEFRSALAPIPDRPDSTNKAANSPRVTSAPPTQNQPIPDINFDLASPIDTISDPHQQILHPQPQIGRALGEENLLYLSPPSSRGVSPTPSNAGSSPRLMSGSPSTRGFPHLQIPEPHSPRSRSPLSVSSAASSILQEIPPDPISERSRRGSDATYVSHSMEPVKRKIYSWWPYHILPAPQDIAVTFFPTLCDFGSKTYTERVIAVLSAPSNLALTLTLPVYVLPKKEKGSMSTVATLDSPVSTQASIVHSQMGDYGEEPSVPSAWCRWLACIQCLVAPLFVILMVFGEEGSMLKAVLWGLVGGLVGLAVLLTFTDSEKAPKYRYLFCFIGFFVGITWISTIANEVVGVLKAFGVILGISDAVLGLTVFAVGNSLGDLVANITLSNLGMPVMALAACFGGPLLNILLGIGGSGLYLIISNPKAPIQFDLTPTLIVSGSTLFVTLVILLVFVPLNNWMMSRRVGVTLIGLWVTSSAVNLFLELTGRSSSL